MNRKICWLGLALLLIFLIIYPLSWWINFYWWEIGELKTLDFRFWIRGARPAPPQIRLVLIDERSLAQLYQRQRDAWPWDRQRWAEFIELVGAAGARSILLDLAFSYEEPADQPGDQQLVQALRRYPLVTLGSYPITKSEFSTYQDLYRREIENNQTYREYAYGTFTAATFSSGSFPGFYKLVPPLPAISQAAAGIGVMEVGSPEVDGVFRSLALIFEERYWMKDSGGAPLLLAPLAIQAVAVYDRIPPGSYYYEAAGQTIRIGNRTVPVAQRGYLTPDFYGPHPFVTYSLIDVLDQRIQLDQAFHDKLVVVGFGSSAKGLYDLRPNPYDPAAPGVELHATIIGNILEGRYLQRWPFWQRWVALLVLGLLSLAALAWLPQRWQGLTALEILIGYNLLGYALFLKGIWLELFYPGLMLAIGFVATNAGRLYQEHQERQRIQNYFGRYLAPEVVREILDRPELQRLGGSQATITAWFADLKGFTKLAESLEPPAMVELLNQYLTLATNIILKHHGTLDKFAGDAVVAFFGAPLRQADAPVRAAAAALELQQEMAKLRSQWQTQGRKELLEIGIGLATGPAVVGNIGAPQHMNYTAIGDTVNIAARLQEATRSLNHNILITAETAAELDSSFIVKQLPPQTLKGKGEKVKVFAVCGRYASEEEDHGFLTIDNCPSPG